MKKYDAYKPSGIEWIGEVPSNWNVARLKFLFSRSIAGVWGEEEKGNNDDIVCFRVADFDYERGCLIVDDNTIRNIDGKSLNGRIIKRNDLLIEKSGGGDTAPVGRVVKVNTDIKATCSNFIHIVTVADDNDPTYIYYYFKFLYSNKINMLFFNQTTGIQNLKVPGYLGQMFYLPPLPEQIAIADYLDAKCAKIDNVVAIQKKRIELLKELKQSIITKAVTKGLDKNAKMKPSGVEWIGEVPNGWKVGKIKFYANIIMGQSPDGKDITDEGKTPFMQGNAEFTEKYPNPIYYCETCNKHSRIGDVLMSVRAPVGELNLSDKIYGIGRGLCSIKAEQELSTPFLWYYLMKSKDDFNSFANGSTFTAITVDDLKNFPLILPPLSEQTAIAAYLDKKCAAIDRQIAKIEKQIELLKEYKQSVITECVTGKRKVC